MKIIVVGNCQAAGLANCLSVLVPDHEIEQRAETADLGDLRETDVVLLQRPLAGKFSNMSDPPPRIVAWPAILFTGFHPDIITLDKQLIGPTGGWHSSICLAAWRQGLDPEETESLFRRDVFEELGFFRFYDRSRKWLAAAIDHTGLPGQRMVSAWCEAGCFVYGVNHPKLRVIADVAREITSKLGLKTRSEKPEDFVVDNMLFSAAWPVFPPISEELGLGKSGYFFKGQNSPVWRLGPTYDLKGFIEASYNLYDKTPSDRLTSERFDTPAYQNLKLKVKRSSGRMSEQRENPYSGLPDFHYWRRAIEKTPASEVDPVVKAKFKISPTDRLATAGSCFAQHISRTLSESGFNYYVAEAKPQNMPAVEGASKNYGVFSARFGNIYTARQLLQLFDRAYRHFAPVDVAWARPDGRYADPFRPVIDPDGFATATAVAAASEEHLAHVRSMFESLDVFVFTLGLTEAWRSRLDGAVFPLAPGVAAGRMDFNQYEFINFAADEVASDLNEFIQKLRSVNRRSKILLTVSPVPLIATYEDRHVLVSTTYSKSALRVAAETAVTRNQNIDYFPSYEMITGAFNKGAYFEDDLRSVKTEGVEHVMSVFLRHYTDAQNRDRESEGDDQLILKEAERAVGVVCDEVWMDR